MQHITFISVLMTFTYLTFAVPCLVWEASIFNPSTVDKRMPHYYTIYVVCPRERGCSFKGGNGLVPSRWGAAGIEQIRRRVQQEKR